MHMLLLISIISCLDTFKDQCFVTVFDNEHSSWTNLANNSKVDKSRTRYLSSPFILPYVLRFKQRDAAKRHKACVY